MRPKVPESWSVIDVLAWTTDYFKKHSIDAPRLNAEQLLAHVLGMDRLQLYLQYDRPLSEQERAEYKVMIKERSAHVPLQYITGAAFFMGLRFFVNNAVLIPRFDTEVLAEKAIEIVQQGDIVHCIDVGTGSGALAISVAHFVTAAHVGASDISPEALAVARKNAEALDVLARVDLREGDLLDPWLPELSTGAPVLVMANLPYVRESEWHVLSAEVKDHEPRGALVSGADGLDHYRRLIGQLSTVRGSWTALLELGIAQVEDLKKLIAVAVPQASVEVIKDLSGHDRCLCLSKK